MAPAVIVLAVVVDVLVVVIVVVVVVYCNRAYTRPPKRVGRSGRSF